MRKLIYISGPITNGSRALNFGNAAHAMHDLILAGFAPICPHLSMLHPGDDQIPYESWMEIDLAMIEVSQAIIRLPGYSPGADRECEFAMSLGLPVFVSVDDLKSSF